MNHKCIYHVICFCTIIGSFLAVLGCQSHRILWAEKQTDGLDRRWGPYVPFALEVNRTTHPTLFIVHEE